MTDRGWLRAPARPPRRWLLGVLLVLAGCTPPGLPAPIAPAASSVAGSTPAGQSAVSIGVDGAVYGFNPHAIADYSLADAAVAGLVLPAVSSVAPDGSVNLNPDVVRVARVTSTSPFTVTYTLDRDAAWSDGTPITAEDFSYLREQMLVQPGTVDPAGYRLISNIVSRDAGKTVEVTFVHAVTDWRTLFSPLLPAHILKDSPGGWVTGLAAGLPVSGNRYKMTSYDAVTGEITLTRNDKYWGTQPGPNMAVLRIGSAAALIKALGRGDLQAVLLQPDAADQRALEAVAPAARRVPAPLPGTVQLIFNTAAGATANAAVRKAVAAALDVDLLRSALTGGNPVGGTPAPSLVRLTSVGTTGVAAVTTGNVPAALAYLAAAGYHRDALYQSRDGQLLRLTLTYPSTDVRLAAAARLIQSQLLAVGIEVDLLRDSALAVVNNRLAAGTVDLGLVLVPRGPSDSLAAGSAFGCPLSTGAAPDAARSPLPRAGNLSGFCLTAVQTLLAQASAGAVPADLDGQLTNELPVIELTRPSAVFATSAAFRLTLPAPGPGSAFSGPLTGLPNWPAG